MREAKCMLGTTVTASAHTEHHDTGGLSRAFRHVCGHGATLPYMPVSNHMKVSTPSRPGPPQQHTAFAPSICPSRPTFTLSRFESLDIQASFAALQLKRATSTRLQQLKVQQRLPTSQQGQCILEYSKEPLRLP